MHFDQGIAWDGTRQVPFTDLLSCSRNSPELVQWANGSWTSVPANTLAISDLGLQVYEQRTNKCTNYNANPTDLTNVTKSGDAAAVLSVVDDSAALALAGLSQIATSGKVYKLDNSAGSATARATISGLTGNTNPHAGSSYIRGGSGGLSPSGAGTSQFATFTASAMYARIAGVFTPADNSRTLTVVANAGQTVYFILNDLEEGSFATPPIITAGAAAARAADVITAIGALRTAALNAKAAFFRTFGVAGGTVPRLIEFSGGALLGFPTINTVGDLATVTVATFGSGTYTGVVKSSYSLASTGRSLVANEGTLVSNATAITGNTGTIYLANRAAGDRALNGFLQRFVLGPNFGMFNSMATTP
jgi:hypothetical protein